MPCSEGASTEPRVPGACTENAELGLSAPRGVLGEGWFGGGGRLWAGRWGGAAAMEVGEFLSRNH
jgi:hypothetical protein